MFTVTPSIQSDDNDYKDPPGIYLRIGEVALSTGLTQRTIRYYEEIGLLPPPTRTQGDYRLYSEPDLARLAEIVRLKSLLGFSLSDIKQIIEGEETRSQLRTEYHAADDAATRLAKLEGAITIAEAQLALVERKQAQMADLQNDLKARLVRYAQKKAELENLVAVETER